jgi:DNA-binding transcriptional LysR family regulator
MSLSNASFRHLAALVTVAHEGSFGAAADELGYSQATISQQIAALEKMMGATLFDRPGGPKPVTLTSAGRALVQHAEHILGHITKADDDVRDHLTGSAGNITIGTFQSVSVHLLPAAVSRLRQTSPQLSIGLFEGRSSEELVHQLLAHEIDVAFIEGPVDDSRVHVVELGRDPYLLLVSPTSPLCELVVANRFPLTALSGHPLIGQPALTYQDDVDAILRTHGITPKYLFRTVDNGAVQAMVRSGVGAAVMPRLAIDLDDPETVTFEFSPALSPRQVNVAVRATEKDIPSIAHFTDAAAMAARRVLDEPSG